MLISDFQWAMSNEYFDALCAQYNRNSVQIVTERYKGLSTTILNGVGYIHVYGTILPRETFMTYFGYGTAIESITNDIVALRNDSQVKAIVLNIDSPGGVLSGVADFAALVKSIDKPVYAFAQKALSAAYWIAASTNKIILTPTGVSGSIGVILSVIKQTGDSNVIDIVSSQSENKNIDPTSDAGKAQLQKLVDDQANVFVSTMAEYRDTTIEKVLSDFGRGAVFAADESKNRGMVDNVQPLPTFLSSLETQNNRRVFAMADQNEKTVANAVDATAEVEKELSRIKAIEGLSSMFSAYPSNVREKISDAINRLKYDKDQTKATVSEHLLKVVAESQKEIFTAESKDREESLSLSKQTTPPKMPESNVENKDKSKVDLGEALVNARKQRLAAMNGGYNVN